MKITGKTLVAMGFEGGKWFPEAIAHSNANQLEGEALDDYLAAFKEAPKIALKTQATTYFKNIEANSPLEKENVEKVLRTMDSVMKTPTTVTGTIMPDACPVGSLGTIPVGGVVVTKNAIHPGMHSADICCSVYLSDLGKTNPKAVLDAAEGITHFGPGGRKKESMFEFPQYLENEIKDNFYLNTEHSLRLAKTHLGTQGDGNHFLYVGISKKTGNTMLISHHGSRGFGAKLYKKGMQVANQFRQKISPDTLKQNAWIPYDTWEGKTYWEALQIVRKWTKTNHECIHQATAKALGVNIQNSFWNEHNFVFKKGDLFYHAKGATPLDTAFLPEANKLRLIPLNMAEPILIVTEENTENSLGFAPHGAGRNTSRSQHKKSKKGTKEHIFEEETKGLDIRFYSKEIDISELPSAYKNATEVQKQMKTFHLGKVVDKVLPYGCIMAGDFSHLQPWRRKK